MSNGAASAGAPSRGADQKAPKADEGLLGVEPPPPARDGWRRFGRWLVTGSREEPAPSRLGVLEAFDPERTGICCSGGGIRSAAFNLGALQALRHEHVLAKAKYLAAVSGGSYVAASVCMVAKTWPRGDGDESNPRPPEGEPGHDDSDPAIVNASSLPFDPQSPEEQYLRNRSGYLAPTALDKVFLGWRLLLGLLLNVIMVGLPLFALGTALAVWLYDPAYGTLERGEPWFSAEPLGAWLALAVLVLAAVLLGLGSLLFRFRRDEVRRAFEVWSTRFLSLLGAAAVLLVLVPELASLLRSRPEAGEATSVATSTPVPVTGAAGLASLVLAALLELRGREPRTKSSGTLVGEAADRLRKTGPKARRAFAYLAGALAGPALLLGVIVVAAAITLAQLADPSVSTLILILTGVVAPLALFGVAYLLCDLTTWSLHPFYRRRLCSAFALKRVRDDDAPAGAPRQRAIERDYDTLVPLSESGVWPGPTGEGWPTLVVCAAANISDPGATPPGRGVSSFTFSRAAIGGPLVGGARTIDYEERLGANRLRDITLPAAVAMSGAALSPSMGKMTRAPLRFLMALANVRLGVWVPNPRYISRRHWKQLDARGREKAAEKRDSGIEVLEDRPQDLRHRPRLLYLLWELLGRNRVDSRFLYVTDGGHYENLGLVELLRRGCGTIYCFDASGGDTGAALGDAIALARSELGVEVEIDPTKTREGDEGLAERSVAVGRIKQRGEEVGRLVYAPLVLTADAPWDVRAYKASDPAFPHHSTAEQFYTDQRFEAYRALGEHAGARTREASPALPEA